MSQSNTNTSGSQELSTLTIEDLVTLIKSLYKIIEGLNAKLEKFEESEVIKVVVKDVPRGVVKDVPRYVVGVSYKMSFKVQFVFKMCRNKFKVKCKQLLLQ